MAIELISKIKPKNNGTFALVDAADVDVSGERLGPILTDGSAKRTRLKPDRYVEGSMYNVTTASEFGVDRTDLAYAVFTVKSGQTLYVTGRSGPSGVSYPLCTFYGASNNKLSTVGTTNYYEATDKSVSVPANAVKMIVNCSNASLLKINVSRDMLLYERVRNLDFSTDGTVESLNAEVSHGYFPPSVDAAIREGKKNPFKWKDFDKGYISFVFDDLRADVDSPCSIFEEYGFPICLAAIPSKRDTVASGLSEARGSYTVGMTMEAICLKVQDLGGEILAHNSSVVTADNQYDRRFMYDYFVKTKTLLEEWGLTVRGIIRAGGTGQIDVSKETERWVVGNYDYSNLGYTEDHTLSRISINQSIENIKSAIDDAVAHNKWIRVMAHDYEYGNGDTFTGEEDLRTILTYCQTKGISVVTYAYMYDKFKSSVLNGGVVMRSEVEPDEYVGQYYYNVNKGTYGPSSKAAHAIYTVVPGTTYYVSGRAASNGNYYPACAFYNDVSNFMIERYGVGENEELTDFIVVAPTGSTYMVVNTSDVRQVPISVKMVIDINRKIELMDNTISDVRSTVTSFDTQITQLAQSQGNARVAMTPVETVTGYILNSLTKTAYPEDNTPRSGFQHKKYAVEAGKTYYVTGRSAYNGNAFPICEFFDEDHVVRLAQYGAGEYQNEELMRVVAPANAVMMVVNSSDTSVAVVEARSEVDTGAQLLALQAAIDDLTARVEALEPIDM